MNLFNLEQIEKFVQPLEASEEQKNEYINLESTLSLSCVYLACKWLIADNRERVFYSDYVNNEISESVFHYDSRPISIGEELLLTESIIYLSQQTTSSGNIRYEIADAFIHSTGEEGQTHFINLLKKRISQMVSNQNRQQNSEADNLFERISAIFSSEEYCFYKDDTEVYCLDCAEQIQNQIESMMLEEVVFENSLSSIRSLFRRFEQIRYNPDSRIAQRIYSTQDLLGMVYLMCKAFQSKFNVNDFYEIIRELVVMWENRQPILYDDVNEEDLDTFQYAIGMYEENQLQEYSILDAEISVFLNSLEMEQVYSILSIMGHPRFRTNRSLAQKINRSEEYARQIKESTKEELREFFENHEETDEEDQQYAIRVITTKCKEMVGIND